MLTYDYRRCLSRDFLVASPMLLTLPQCIVLCLVTATLHPGMYLRFQSSGLVSHYQPRN